MKSSRLWIRRPYLIVTALLFAGGFIYVFLRESEPLFFRISGTGGFFGMIISIRQITLPLSSLLPEWIIYSLPDAIWSFAYSLLIVIIWWKNQTFLKYVWLASIPIIIVCVEVFQLNGLFPGTFTISDLLFECSGMCLGIFAGIIHLKTKYHEEPSTQIDCQT